MIAYHQLVSMMIGEVPELRLPYQRLKAEWRSGESPGPHIVLADAVIPFLDEVLAGGHTNVIDSMLQFVERALGTGDDRVIEAIGQSFLEPLAERPVLRAYALSHSGPKTKSLAHDLL